METGEKSKIGMKIALRECGHGPRDQKGGADMKVIRKEYTVEVMDGVTAKVIVTLAWQSAPWDNDGVTAEAIIELPSNQYGELERELVFGERVWLMGEQLHRKWGTEKDGFVRYRSEIFTGLTRSDAMNEGEKCVMCELAKLADAIEIRRKATER